MKPDFADLLPEPRDAGRRSVPVAPIQILADYPEVLCDIDIGARTEADDAGTAFAHVKSLDVIPALVTSLCDVARMTAPLAQTGFHSRLRVEPRTTRQGPIWGPSVQSGPQHGAGLQYGPTVVRQSQLIRGYVLELQTRGDTGGPGSGCAFFVGGTPPRFASPNDVNRPVHVRECGAPVIEGPSILEQGHKYR